MGWVVSHSAVIAIQPYSEHSEDLRICTCVFSKLSSWNQDNIGHYKITPFFRRVNNACKST